MSHLSEQDFADLWNDRLEPAEMRRAVRHLMTGCEVCRARLLRGTPEEPSFWGRERPPEDAYDAAIDRAWRNTRKLLPRWNKEREHRDRALEPGRELTPRERQGRGVWAHVEIYLQRAFDLRYSNPAEMLRILKDVVQVADRGDARARAFGDALLLDLRARARGELANAYRVNERYAEARSEFETAHSLLDEGTGDLFLRARLWDMESSLQRTQGRFADAVQLLNDAHLGYAKLGERRLAGRTLMRKATCLGIAGKPHESVGVYRQVLAQLDAERDTELFAITQQNLLTALVEAGQLGEAGRLLVEGGLRQRFADDPLVLLRIRWSEARILAGHGRLADAERVFGDVRAGFHERGLLYDEALVGMDLAVVLIKQGKDPWNLAWELYTACGRVHGFQPGAGEALTAFEVLCRLQVATVPWAERIRDFLGRLQHFPRLRFEPEKILVG